MTLLCLFSYLEFSMHIVPPFSVSPEYKFISDSNGPICMALIKANQSWHYSGPRSHGNILSYSSKYMDRYHWFVSLNNLGEVSHDFENLFLLPYARLKEKY